jgi:transcriptional regulator with XRE-family HTH domain
MTSSRLEQLSRQLREKRGDRGVREAAQEIGISPATLSRVERGHLPDLETFGKICRWLKTDPAAILGVASPDAPPANVAVHFRKEQTLAPATAQALAQLILAAHRFRSSS